jgi:hypothetical protein
MDLSNLGTLLDYGTMRMNESNLPQRSNFSTMNPNHQPNGASYVGHLIVHKVWGVGQSRGPRLKVKDDSKKVRATK